MAKGVFEWAALVSAAVTRFGILVGLPRSSPPVFALAVQSLGLPDVCAARHVTVISAPGWAIDVSTFAVSVPHYDQMRAQGRCSGPALLVQARRLRGPLTSAIPSFRVGIGTSERRFTGPRSMVLKRSQNRPAGSTLRAGEPPSMLSLLVHLSTL